MAVSVHQPRHQQLRAVADDAGTGIFGRDCGERSRFPDGAVRNHNSAGLDHTRCSRIGDYICAPHDDGLGHSLAHPCNSARPRSRARTSFLWRALTYTRCCGKNRQGTVRRSWPFARGAEARLLRPASQAYQDREARGFSPTAPEFTTSTPAAALQDVDRTGSKGIRLFEENASEESHEAHQT